MGNQYNTFPCPLLLTSVIFFIQWMFGLCASELFPRYLGVAVVKNMTWKTYLGEMTHDLLVKIFEDLNSLLEFFDVV